MKKLFTKCVLSILLLITCFSGKISAQTDEYFSNVRLIRELISKGIENKEPLMLFAALPLLEKYPVNNSGKSNINGPDSCIKSNSSFFYKDSIIKKAESFISVSNTDMQQILAIIKMQYIVNRATSAEVLFEEIILKPSAKIDFDIKFSKDTCRTICCKGMTNDNVNYSLSDSSGKILGTENGNSNEAEFYIPQDEAISTNTSSKTYKLKIINCSPKTITCIILSN